MFNFRSPSTNRARLVSIPLHYFAVYCVLLRCVVEGGVDLTPLITTLTMIGKFSMTAAFGTVVLYAPEIYPTNLR